MVHVLFVPFNGVELHDTKSVVEWKREAVWGNAARNKLLAELAEGLARTPKKVVREYGINPTAVHLPDRVRQRVVILVENVEHARRLQKLLPAWELWHALPHDGEPYELEEDPNELPPLGVIATLMYVARNGINCDILVRATAGTGRLSWGFIRGVGNRMGTTPALVVDIANENGKRESLNTDIRRREYQEQGLEVLKATELKGAT